jgi:hypothetical protein
MTDLKEQAKITHREVTEFLRKLDEFEKQSRESPIFVGRQPHRPTVKELDELHDRTLKANCQKDLNELRSICFRAILCHYIQSVLDRWEALPADASISPILRSDLAAYKDER